jgi:hypothetical protein
MEFLSEYYMWSCAMIDLRGDGIFNWKNDVKY